MSSTVAGKNEGSPVNDSEVVSAELVKVPSAGLVAAVRKADERRPYTKAAATRTGYESDWKRFQAWAVANGAPYLPAAPEIVCAYLESSVDDGCSVATLERFLSAGRHYHRAVGLDFPRNAPIVKETLSSIRHRIGVRRTKKAPLGLKALADICERLRREVEGRSDAARVESLRNRAMLTVGWWCMLRGASLVAIRREHVRLVRSEDEDWIDGDRPNGLILHLPGSKTDQLKEGRDVAVYAQADETVCPVRALVGYFHANRFAPEDLIFPVSERKVSRLIKLLIANPAHGHKSLREIADCESCEAATRRFASHSLRRGSATEQARRGVPEREIMRQGGWKNERVMRGYIEHATLFENNPTKGLSGESAAPASPARRRRRRLRSRTARAFHAR